MGATAFDLIAKLTLDSADYDKGLDAAESKAGSIGGKMGSALGTVAKVGAAAIGATAAAVGAFAKSSIDAGLTFDASMSNVAAISGATGEEFDALRTKAQEMGASTKFTATEAADAMSYMAMAGWKTEDMLDGIEGIMNLAAASGEDLALTSDIVTDALTGFGLSAKDSSHFADILAAASSNANTNVALMGETFKYVAPVAGSMGISAEDAAESIGLIANAGIKGSQAGTSLRAIITRLATDAGASSKSLGALGILTDELGVEFYDAEGNVRDFSDILDEARVQWQKLGDEDAATFAKKIAGQEGISAWLALMNSAPEDVEKLREAIDTCSDSADGFNGTADEMARKMEDNLQGSITKFKSALEGVQIAVSDFLSPTLREFVDIATGGIGDIANALREGDFDGAMEIVGNLLSSFIQKIAEILPQVVESAAQVLASFAQGIIQNLPSLMASATEIIVKLAEYLIQGIPQFIITAFQIIQILALGIINALPELLPAALSAIQAIAAMLVENIGALVDSCVQIVTMIAQFIAENAGELATAAVAVIARLADAIINALPDLVPAAVEAVIALTEALIDNVDVLIDASVEIIIALADAIIDNLPTLLEKAPDIIHKLTQAIIDATGKLIDAGTEIVAKLVVFIIKNFPKILGVAVQLVTEFIRGIHNIRDRLKDAGGDIINRVWEGIKSLDPFQWGKDLIDEFIGGISRGIDGLTRTASDIAGTVRSYIGFSEPEKGPLSNFHTYAPDMMKLFAQGIKDNEKLITDQLRNSFDFENELSPKFGLRRETSSIVMNVYGAQGQDVNELADVVMKKLTWKTQQDRRAWA